jgi:LemA protein
LARVAHVQRPGGIGRDELDHHAAPGPARAAAEAGAGVQRARDDRAARSGRQAQVDEAGAGDLGGGHELARGRIPRERVADGLRDLARRLLQRARQLQRHVAGEVAVGGLLGPLEQRLGRGHAGGRRQRLDRRADARRDLGGVFGKHPTRGGLWAGRTRRRARSEATDATGSGGAARRARTKGLIVAVRPGAPRRGRAAVRQRHARAGRTPSGRRAGAARRGAKLATDTKSVGKPPDAGGRGSLRRGGGVTRSEATPRATHRMSTSLIFGLMPALLAVWFVLTWNRLVELRNRWRNAFAQIDVQLKRRHDLVPNLVETARAYLAHERATLEAVTRARGAAAQARAQAAADPGDARGLSALDAAEALLGGSLGRLMAVAEAHPELKADQTMRELAEELASTENRVGFARQAFNDAVMGYNTARESLPANLVATLGGFTPAALLASTRSARERAAPRVEF